MKKHLGLLFSITIIAMRNSTGCGSFPSFVQNTEVLVFAFFPMLLSCTELALLATLRIAGIEHLTSLDDDESVIDFTASTAHSFPGIAHFETKKIKHGT